MLRTRSPSARAVEAAERQVRLQRRQQREQQLQQQHQQANKPATPPAPRNEVALKCLTTESNTKINSNSSSINISNNHSNIAIVASAITPASARGSRFSFGPVPNERYSIESGLSFSFSSPSPPTPDDHSCSRTSPHLQQEGAPSADDGSSSNESESSSCVVVGVNGIDAETNENHVADTDKYLLSTSTTSSIELAPARKGEGEGGETSATAVPAAAAAFMGPAQAILADPAIQHAMGNAMDVASNANYMTQEAYSHAAALAAQSQVQVGLAWQGVISAMLTVTMSLKTNNEKLTARNIELEADNHECVRRISRLGGTVSILIAQRDRLAAKLQESGAGLPAKTSAKGNGSDNDNGCVVYNCTSPVGGIGLYPATPAGATALRNRAADVAKDTVTAIAPFPTPTSKRALVSGTGTAIGQPDFTVTTAAVPAVINAIPETTTTTTTAPQQCEVGLPTRAVLLSGTPSAIAALSTATCTSAPLISASIANPTPHATRNEKPNTGNRSTSVSDTALAAAASASTAPTAPTSRRRSVNTPGSTTGGRAPWVGGGVGGGVSASPPAVGNRGKDSSPSVSLSERLENETRQEDAKRTPLGSVRINTVPKSVSSTAGKGTKASPCVPTPTLVQASSTRGVENQQTTTYPTATVAVKRIISDDRGATDGNRKKPEGMYARLRSAGKPRKTDTKVVAGGGKQVVSGTGVSSRKRQEAAANNGATGRRSKVVPKQRWR
eukprot:jgi/Undpi1/1620/HiC_scaffold_11.g05010.m1